MTANRLHAAWPTTLTTSPGGAIWTCRTPELGCPDYSHRLLIRKQHRSARRSGPRPSSTTRADGPPASCLRARAGARAGSDLAAKPSLKLAPSEHAQPLHRAALYGRDHPASRVGPLDM